MSAGRSSSGRSSRSSRWNLGKEVATGPLRPAKIGLIATLAAALIAGTATVLVAPRQPVRSVGFHMPRCSQSGTGRGAGVWTGLITIDPRTTST